VWYDEAEGVCPITAQEIEIDPKAVGAKQIVVRRRREDAQTATPARTVRYRLINGRYVTDAERSGK
jgi:hypothetical protein